MDLLFSFFFYLFLLLFFSFLLLAESSSNHGGCKEGWQPREQGGREGEGGGQREEGGRDFGQGEGEGAARVRGEEEAPSWPTKLAGPTWAKLPWARSPRSKTPSQIEILNFSFKFLL